MIDHRIASLDFGKTFSFLTHPKKGVAWSGSAADMAIEYYRCFLDLILKQAAAELVPCAVIDTVWHAHILDTHKYAVDCKSLFDGLLHHDPYFGMADDALERSVWRAAFTATQTLFMGNYGKSLDELASTVHGVYATSEPAPAICKGRLCGYRTKMISF